jgi:mannose-6-phosphate isomerase-like protein (cupin superfamily)
VRTHVYTHRYPAAELLNKHFVPMIVEHHARTLEEFGELIRHPGEEFCYVIEGAIVLHTELYEPLRLSVGDSVYFDSRMGHAYLAGAEGPCRALSVCSPERHFPETTQAEEAVSEPVTRPPRPQVTRSARVKRSRRR